ncbi:MAG: hypothetical protein Q7U57_03870 [Methylovulum sp.]|nr:hypothetical protein [Methylovulum sp.]
MKIKLAALAAFLSALIATAAVAGDIKPLHGGIAGSLGANPLAEDIVLYTCGKLPGLTIDHAAAAIQDLDPVAKPRLTVRIAKWSGSVCGVFAAAAGDPVDDDGIPGAEAVKPLLGGNYCIKINKTAAKQNGATGPKSANGAENYELDTHCLQQGVEEHAASTFVRYIKNQ